MNSTASVGGSERLRLFCALTLPDDAVERLVAWQSAFVPAGDGDFRLVAPSNLHVTLAFLGHRPLDEVEGVWRELAAAAERAGPIVLRPCRYRETRSVGMLVFDDEGGAAGRLAADLHGRLQRLGVYEPERRPWLAHVTVVRFRRPPRLQPGLPELEAANPSGAAVYHSVLRPTGAQYEILYPAALGG